MAFALSSPSAVVSVARSAVGSTRVRGLAAAVAVYATAVFHRSSLGVAGLDAADRFGISAGALSVFVLLQLGVYAGMQIPTGVLVDRFGPRRLLLVAACTSALAQLCFAVAPSYAAAVGARALLGAGDALTFISVVSFVSQHFSARRFTLIVAATGTLGALGNMAATVPLNAALDAVGWTPTFAVAALSSVVAALAVARFVPPSPAARPDRRRQRSTSDLRRSAVRVGANVRAAWSTSATRAGFWLHCATMTFTVMFGVLWGMPYLVAQGFTRGEASAMLTLSVVAGAVSSGVVGAVFGRFRAARVPFALGVAGVTIIGWSVILAGFDGPPPRWLLAIAVAVTAVGGPASGIGFSLTRDYNPIHLVGTSSGVVNVGGFVCGIVATVTVGQLLDLAGAQDADAFRLAFAAALVVQGVALVQAVRWYRRLRSQVLVAQERGDAVPVPAVRRRWDLAA